MHKVLHPREDIDWLCVSRKQRVRQLATIEEHKDASTERIEDYFKKEKEDQLQKPQRVFAISLQIKKQKKKWINGDGKKDNWMDISSDKGMWFSLLVWV